MKTEKLLNREVVNMPRRSFLRYAGAGAAGMGVLAAASCKKDPIFNKDSVNVGSGDTGILNYAYAIEQLTMAFYDDVVTSPYENISIDEMALLVDIRNHDTAHRDVLKGVLGSNAIRLLVTNFSSVNFHDRNSVLSTALILANLSVSAYNGAAVSVKSADNLTLLGKIVSVEGRHASVIANMVNSGSFVASPQVDSNGMDVALNFSQATTITNRYLQNPIVISGLS